MGLHHHVVSESSFTSFTVVKLLVKMPPSPSQSTIILHFLYLIVHWRFLRALGVAGYLWIRPMFRQSLSSFYHCFLRMFQSLSLMLDLLLISLAHRELRRCCAMDLLRRPLHNPELLSAATSLVHLLVFGLTNYLALYLFKCP